ncbi:GET complex subunit get1 [Kappamyces sp. JEL0829]|nr:GET complex subunit get1 [Kappamyces sp. JEL0829]
MSHIASVFFARYLALFPSRTALELKRSRTELIRIKKELSAISAQDDFAKWARLRRQFDKVAKEHDELATSVKAFKVYVTSLISIGIPVFLWGVQIIMLVIWCAEPVFYVPDTWFGPLTSWLKFPFAPNGTTQPLI